MDNRNLGVNKLGKNIRKGPIQQPPNFGNTTSNSTTRQQPQPQIYSINKNDFRSIVQQLTGSPSRDPLPRPPHNPPKPPSRRLQMIRPPPLSPPMNRPQIPIHHHHPPPPQPQPIVPTEPVPYSNSNAFARPAPQFGQPSPRMFPLTPSDSSWGNTDESPISAYMRYLQNSFIDSGSRQPQPQAQAQPQVSGQIQDHLPLLPNPQAPTLPSPRISSSPLLPSPTSQFLLPSPSGFLNLFSPRLPYPLLSPGYQFPSPLTPNFAFSPLAQSGILGPGPHPPLSPGIGFLSSPGFFPITSPRWRNQ